MTSSTYSFRKVRSGDLPLLQRWLQSPEVRRWWGEPEDQIAEIQENLDDPRLAMWIVCCDGHPFAFAQDYPTDAWPQAHLADLPPGSRSIDAFIGEATRIGRGHGAAFLRLLAQKLISEGAPVVAIDPVVENMRARRAYARAGFQDNSIVNTMEGLAVLMIFDERPQEITTTGDSD